NESFQGTWHNWISWSVFRGMTALAAPFIRLHPLELPIRPLAYHEMKSFASGRGRGALLGGGGVITGPRINRVPVPVGIAVLVEAHLDAAIGSVLALIAGVIAERIALFEPGEDGLHRVAHRGAVARVNHFTAGLPADFLHIMKPRLRVRQKETLGVLQIPHFDAVNGGSGLLSGAHHLGHIARLLVGRLVIRNQ